jgi:hypothetical protein
MDFEAYLDQALGVTLILDDGTRVKPLFVDWATLPPVSEKLRCTKSVQPP